MNTQSDASVTKKIQIGQLLKESWQLVNGLKMPIFLIFLLYFVIFIPYLILNVAISLSALINSYPQPPHAELHPTSIILFCLFFILMSYIISIAIMVGVRHAIGLPAKIKLAFSECMQVKTTLFYLFLVNLVMIGIFEFINKFILPEGMLGMVLVILLYIILLYCTLPLYLFALPLIVTKRLDVFTAIEKGFGSMKRYWLEIIVSYLIICVISVISMIPLGIGLFWTGPMYFSWVGILFRDAYGLKKRVAA